MSDAPQRVPWAPIVAALALLVGASLVVAAVFILSGIGWALLAAAAHCFLFASVILRGLTRGK